MVIRATATVRTNAFQTAAGQSKEYLSFKMESQKLRELLRGRRLSTAAWLAGKLKGKARVAALQAVMAEEDRIAALRETLSAASFRLEGPLNMMASAVGMLVRRQGETDPMAVALADAMAAQAHTLADAAKALAEAPEADSKAPVEPAPETQVQRNARILAERGLPVGFVDDAEHHAYHHG